MTTLTPEQRRALQEIVYHKLAMWDASANAEKLLGRDICTAGPDLDYLASGIDVKGEAFMVSDEDLIETFDLNDEAASKDTVVCPQCHGCDDQCKYCNGSHIVTRTSYLEWNRQNQESP